MVVAISAGHTPNGGAVGYFKESEEARKITTSLYTLLNNYTKVRCYDFTDNVNTQQGANLMFLQRNHNSVNADVNISIHFNAFNKERSNGRQKGSEVLLHEKTDSLIRLLGQDVLDQLKNVGFKSRGLKNRNELTFLRTVNNSLIIEVCFCDDEDDYNHYKKIGGSKTIAMCIFYAICGWAGIEVDYGDVISF